MLKVAQPLIGGICASAARWCPAGGLVCRAGSPAGCHPRSQAHAAGRPCTDSATF